MVIIGIALTFFLGYSFLRLIDRRMDALIAVFLSYLLGLGLQTLFMFYMAAFHVKLSLYSVGIAILGLTTTFLLLGFLTKDRFWEFPSTLINQLKNAVFTFRFRMNFVERILTLVIICIFGYVVFFGLYWPVFGWDSIALYDFRAKVFASTGFMDDAIRRGYFFGYPLMTSMAHAWVYLLGFKYPKFLYSLMYISMSLLFYKFVRPGLSRRTALFFTFMMMLSPELFSHASFDYTNLPYTAYFFISEVFLVRWFKEKRTSLVVLSGLFMGFATWIRSTDPFWIVNIVAVLISVILAKRSFKDLLVYLAAFLPIQQSWNVFLSYMSPNVTSQALIGGSVGVLLKGISFMRAIQVLDFINIVVGPILKIYLIIAGLSFYFARRRIKENLFLYLLVFGNFGVLYLGSYIFSFIYPGWGAIGESLGRMVFVFIPLLFYLTAVNFHFFGTFKTNEK